MKFTTLWAIIVAVYVTLSMAKDTGWLVARFATHILRMTLSWISIDSDKTTCMQMSRSEMISLTRLATALVKVWHKIFTLLFQWSTILYNSYHLTGQNNCWKNWIKCAGKLAACAAECMNNTTSQSCISCLTPLYTECKYCFSEIEESRKSGNKMQYTICCTTLTIGIYNYHNWTQTFMLWINYCFVISTRHLLWVSGEWTYYMYGQLILWTDWLRIPNHITVISFTSKC